ncbi:ABC transporter ATP-binding protein, partial [Streptomyces sp. ZG43]
MRRPGRKRPPEDEETGRQRVSASEEELFGGPLRYDTGWSRHDYAFEGQTLGATLRAFPGMVAGTLRLAARADRRALWTVGAA